MNIFFSSDFHLNHRNIAGPTVSSWDSGYRDFSSVEEMNETIIQNMNAVIKPEDTLYFLGDFLFGMDKLANFAKFWAMLNVRNKVFIRGNHENYLDKPAALAEVEKIVGKVHTLLETNICGYDFWLCHYSPEEYYSRDKPHHVSFTRENRVTEFNEYTRDPNKFYCFGHYHSTSKLTMDCGVDVEIPEINHKKFTPFNVDEVISYLSKRQACQN